MSQNVTRAGGRRPTVLIADGLGLVLVMLRAELHKRGCGAVLASDGHEALVLYEGLHDLIDLVLLDARTARLDGPQALEGMRQFNPSVRCCFMTGRCGAGQKAEWSKLGVERVFDKPFHPAEVADEVLELLGSGRAGGAAQKRFARPT